jgi:hypothetical protein
MKNTVLALSWSILALGVCSSGLAQQNVGPYGDETRRPDGFHTGNLQLTDAESPQPMPAVNTDDFPKPITESLYDSSGSNCCDDNAYCCDNDSSGFLSGWRAKFVPYVWLSEIHGNATAGGVTQNIHISTRDLLDLLEHDTHFFFSGKLELEQEDGPLGIIANGYYLNAGLVNDIEFFNFTKKFEQAIVDVAFTYELEGMAEALYLPPCSKLDLLAGFRYWMFDTAVTVTGPFGATGSFDGKSEWVDPFIGGRFVVPLNCYSNLQVRGDFGGFDWGTASHFTWNLEALVEMNCSSCCALRAGYRILDVDHTKGIGNQQLGFDVQYRGPVAEIAFAF